MTWTDEKLRDTYRRHLARGGPRRTDCPDDTVLERYLLGTLGTAERDRLADHLESCTACGDVLRELGPLADWAERAAAARRPAASRRVVPRALAALAAGLIVTVGGSLIWTRAVDHRPTDDVSRGTTVEVSPLPGAAVASAPVRFDWPDEPGAAGYRLRLFGPRADLLWESDGLTGSDCELPADVAAGLTGGSRYSWTVQVEGSVQRRELGPFGFEITP